VSYFSFPDSLLELLITFLWMIFIRKSNDGGEAYVYKAMSGVIEHRHSPFTAAAAPRLPGERSAAAALLRLHLAGDLNRLADGLAGEGLDLLRRKLDDALLAMRAITEKQQNQAA
jgi:hypothetical protein